MMNMQIKAPKIVSFSGRGGSPRPDLPTLFGRKLQFPFQDQSSNSVDVCLFWKRSDTENNT